MFGFGRLGRLLGFSVGRLGRLFGFWFGRLLAGFWQAVRARVSAKDRTDRRIDAFIKSPIKNK